MFRMLVLSCVLALGSTILFAVGPTHAQETSFVWRDSPQWAGQLDLMSAGKQVGAYNADQQVYRSRVGEGWSEPCAPPVPLPAHMMVTVDGVTIDPNGPPKGERWTLTGQTVTPEQGAAAIPPALPDDESKGWLIFHGSPAFIARCAADVSSPAVAPLVGKRRVSFVPAGEWQEKDREGKPVLAPGVWFTAADGSRATRIAEADYTGPDMLAGALRISDGTDPATFPTPMVGAVTDNIIPVSGGISAVVLAIVAFLKRKVS